MALFGGIEAQRLGEGREKLVGRPHIPSLFQPRVPGGPNVGEYRHLLATQARRSPPETVGQADVGRRQALSSRAQKVPGLASAGGGTGDCSVAHEPNHSTINTRISRRLFALSHLGQTPAERRERGRVWRGAARTLFRSNLCRLNTPSSSAAHRASVLRPPVISSNPAPGSRLPGAMKLASARQSEASALTRRQWRWTPPRPMPFPPNSEKLASSITSCWRSAAARAWAPSRA